MTEQPTAIPRDKSDLDIERFVVSRADTEPSELIDEVGDDRASIRAGDKVLLIVENDLRFARFLLDTAREKGFKGPCYLAWRRGACTGQDFNPAAVTLDISSTGHGGMERFGEVGRMTSRVATFPFGSFPRKTSGERATATGERMALLSRSPFKASWFLRLCSMI